MKKFLGKFAKHVDISRNEPCPCGSGKRYETLPWATSMSAQVARHRGWLRIGIDWTKRR